MGGRVHDFSVGGLYNGLVLLIDDQTGTYWDHITGEARHGPLQGERLLMWGIRLTTVEAAVRQNPALQVLRSPARLMPRLIDWVMWAGLFKRRLPPFFRRTMTGTDPRLPEMELGLGVVGKTAQRFYPRSVIGSGLQDELAGTTLHIDVDPASKIPHAAWADGSIAVQLFCRWYGFAFSYPRCDVFEATPAP